MTGISPALAFEVAETWETMAEMEAKSSPDRRATLRECADMVRMLATRATPPATPIAGDVLTLDRWGILEQLAKAAIADNDNPCIFAATQSLDTFNQSANPAAILELIAAARQQPNREG
jgi:hypothetical protein